MTKLLEEAFEKARSLPAEDQDVAAEILLSLISKRVNIDALDEETREAIREGLEQAQRGEFLSDEDMRAFFKRHGV